MIQTKPWVLLLLKFLWILHPGAEQDQAASVNQAPKSSSQGLALAKELKCAKYLECSAKNQKVAKHIYLICKFMFSGFEDCFR